MRKALLFVLALALAAPWAARAQQSVPYTQNFDSGSGLPTGWTHLGWGGTSIVSSSSFSYGCYGGSGSALQFNYGNTYQLGNEYNVVVLPEFDQEISGLMVSFFTCSEGYANDGRPYDNSGHFDVGYVTDATSSTSFVAVDTYEPSDFEGLVGQEFEVGFADAPEGARIAFRHRPEAYNYFWFLDEVVVGEATDCMRPGRPTATTITSNSATITISGTASGYTLVWSATELADPSTGENSASLDEGSYEITDLDASTAYHVYVRAECGDESSSWSHGTFRTECGSVSTLPWTDDFESYTVEQAPTCYMRMNTGNTSQNYLKVYNYYSHGGSKCLYFNYVNGTNTIMLPPFDFDISGLELSFWHHPESTTNAYCGTLQVGYVTDNTDASTFVPTASFAYNEFTSTNYRQDEAYFAGAPEGARIAFRHVGSGSANWYWVVDDLDLHEAPACTKPSVVASNVTDEGADLSISDANGLNNYRIYISGRDTIEVTGNEYSFDDLTPSTTYELKVFTVCDDGSLSQPNTISLRTECAEMQLPYHVSFASVVDPCWNNPNNMTITSSEQAVYTGSANGRLISPYIPGNLADKEVRINWRSYSNGGGYAAKVGIGDANGENVQWLATVTDNGTYEETVVYLNQYTGTENHLVIGGGGGYSYVRTVDIEVSSGCLPVGNLAVSDVTSSSATVSWDEQEDASGYVVEYRTANGEWTEVSDVDGFSVELSGLQHSTTYELMVRANCSGDTSRATRATFKTSCEMYTQADLPISDNFDSYSQDGEIGPCWERINLYTTGSYNYPAPYSSPGGRSGMSLYAYNGTGQLYSYLILPPVDDLNGLMLSFDYYISMSGWQLQAGTMTNPSDATTFTPFHTTTGTTTSTWYNEEVIVPAGTDANYIAIRSYGNGDCSGYYDNVTLMIAPACVRPNSISVSNITDQTATLTINDPTENGNYHVFYTVVGSTDTTFLPVTSDLTIEVEELTSSSRYYVGVYTECEDGTVTTTVGTQFRTECATMQIPYHVSFASEVDPCWYNPNSMSITSSEQAVYTGAASGRLVSPAIPGGLADKQVRITWRGYSDSYDCQVGIGDADGDNVTWLATTPSGTYTESIVFLNQYTGTENHLVFGGGRGYAYIRTVDIEPASDCLPVTNLQASDIDDEGATISWDEQENALGYAVEYRTANGSWVELTGVSGTTANLSGLQSSTSYEVRVRTACADDSSFASTISFRTACGSINALPWSEDFAGNSSGVNSIVPCWDILYGNDGNWSADGSKVYLSTTGNPTPGLIIFGDNGRYTFTGDYLGRGIAILPIFGFSADEMTLSFDAQFQNSGSNETLEIGYMPNTTNGSDFEVIDTIAYTGSGWHTHQVTISNYEPSLGRLAFRYSYTVDDDYYFIYLDNFELTSGGSVNPVQPCDAPTNLHTTAVDETSATLDWNSSAQAWAISVDNGTEQTVSSHPYTLEGLTPNTQYSVRVKALCDDDNESGWTTLSFTTEQLGVESAEAGQVWLYPNPASSSVSVSFEGQATIEVIDQSGRTVASTQATDAATLDVHALARGAYYVRISSATSTAVRKLVVK